MRAINSRRSKWERTVTHVEEKRNARGGEIVQTENLKSWKTWAQTEGLKSV
jgi:hypothetical protein